VYPDFFSNPESESSFPVVAVVVVHSFIVQANVVSVVVVISSYAAPSLKEAMFRFADIVVVANAVAVDVVFVDDVVVVVTVEVAVIDLVDCFLLSSMSLR
jgi:hypothetical protein